MNLKPFNALCTSRTSGMGLGSLARIALILRGSMQTRGSFPLAFAALSRAANSGEFHMESVGAEQITPFLAHLATWSSITFDMKSETRYWGTYTGLASPVCKCTSAEG